MKLKSRVAVHSRIGRRVFTAHRELAMMMVRDGEADYATPGIIVLTQSVRTTAEMQRPRIAKIKVNRAKSSAGDAGRGLTFLPPVKTVHYPSLTARTPVHCPEGNVIGYRMAA